jgi:hypothetical protein
VGPNTDHTTGASTGYYLYAPASDVTHSTKATLRSQTFSPALEDDECRFRFFHHFNQKDVTTVEVFKR